MAQHTTLFLAVLIGMATSSLNAASHRKNNVRARLQSALNDNQAKQI